MIVTLLRKTLEGSVAENTLKHGCGGINIDVCRISTSDSLNGGAYAETPTERHDGKESWRFERGRAGEYEQPSGRWPANFILTHLEGCELKGTKKVKAPKHREANTHNSVFCHTQQRKKYQPDRKKYNRTDEDGKETVANWDCAEGCPVQELDRQSKSTGGRIGNKGGAYSHLGETGFKDNAIKGDPGFGDVGGASRFFKQFKKEDEQ